MEKRFWYKMKIFLSAALEIFLPSKKGHGILFLIVFDFLFLKFN